VAALDKGNGKTGGAFAGYFFVFQSQFGSYIFALKIDGIYRY
jgi:hypothetical protein